MVWAPLVLMAANTFVFVVAYYAGILLLRDLGVTLELALAVAQMLLLAGVAWVLGASTLRTEWRRSVRWSPVYFLLGALLQFLLHFGIAALNIPYSDANVRALIAPMSATALTSAVLLAPLLEELFFREHLWRLTDDWGPRLRVFVIAIAFALYHLDWRWFPHTFLAGLVLGALRENVGLRASVFFHAGFNAAGVATVLLT